MGKLTDNTIALIVLGTVATAAMWLMGKDALVLVSSISSGVIGWLSHKSTATTPGASAQVQP